METICFDYSFDFTHVKLAFKRKEENFWSFSWKSSKVGKKHRYELNWNEVGRLFESLKFVKIKFFVV